MELLPGFRKQISLLEAETQNISQAGNRRCSFPSMAAMRARKMPSTPKRDDKRRLTEKVPGHYSILGGMLT
jgi:hypothetical protein